MANLIDVYSPLELNQRDYTTRKPGFLSSLTSTKKLIILSSFLGIVSIGLLISLIAVTINPNEEASCFSEECILSAGYLSSSMDLNADPCDNFYQYVCGKWKEDHPFPANVDGWSHFYKLSYGMRNDLRKLLDERSDIDKSPNAIKKLYNFYHGCINTTSRNSVGYSPLLRILDEIGGWPSINKTWSDNDYDWTATFVKLIKIKLYLIMRIEVINDWRNTSRSILKIGPALADQQQRQYPAVNGTKDQLKAESFLIKNITQELVAGHTPTIDDDIRFMYEFRLKLTKSASPVKSLDYYQKNYSKHIVLVKDLDTLYPSINFSRILNVIFNSTIGDDDEVLVPDFDYLTNIGALINSTDKRILANYFATHVALSFGEYTTTNMIELLVDKLDAPEVLPNICFSATEKLLPDLLGRLYLDKFYRHSSRQDMKFLISLLHESFYQLLKENSWMDSNTKQEAINKLDAMSQNIAFPEWTMDDIKLDLYYDKIGNISADNFFASVLQINEANQLQQILDLSDKIENECSTCWPSHNAMDVNAFYYFSTNGIYFPAGIAQYPFYMFGRPMAMNLGSIGMIIGHEMTHGFDNSGSHYDSNGDLKNWWTNSTRDLFINKSQCFVDQYNKYSVEEQNMTVNGLRTLGENIADNGGIREAYRAYQLYKSRFKEDLRTLPGSMSQFSGDQLFFISFANMWCANMSPENIAYSINRSVHSPESIRVKGSLANFDEFAKTFDCPIGTNMNPEKKCILW